MYKKAKEIFQIISAIVLMFAGLALMLRFLNGLLIIGAVLMAIGITIWSFLLREVIIKK